MSALSFDLGPRRGLPAPGQAPGAAACRLSPRDWQRRLIQLLRARLLQPQANGHDVLVHAGPGAGKTLGALFSVQRLRQEGHLRRAVVFCHRTSIARQWQAAAERLGLRLREWDPESGHEECDASGLLLSYQSAARHRQRLALELEHELRGEPWLAIADEVHHLGLDPLEPDATAWGHAFSCLSSTASLRLGLTGTPFRADNLAFCAARRIRVEEHGEISERIVPDLSVEPRQLILAGDVRPLEFHFQDGWVEHGRAGRADGSPQPHPSPRPETLETSPLSAEVRESWRARNLRRAIRIGDGSAIAERLLLQARLKLERIRHEHPGAGGLVIARNIAHAGRVSALLREQGDRVVLAHSGDPEAAGRLAAFRGGDGDWLVSIDMCAEGFDAPRLRVVVYLTTVVSRSRFVQGITRAVRMDEERAGLEAIPRRPSAVFAPADPLLIGHARSWSTSEPYLIRCQPEEPDAALASGSSAGRLPLQALADDAGDLIRLGGPRLPDFLGRSA